MATQAQITINGLPGSNTDLVLGSTVTLGNIGAGGELTYEWTLLSQPTGSPNAVLSSTSSASPTFVVNKEGSYLIRLIVNKGLGDEKTDQVIAAVLELQTGNRIPAALETTEVNTDSGWAYSAVNDILQRVTRLTDTGTFVAIANESLSPGNVVHMVEMSTIASGLPGQRVLPQVGKALANDLTKVDGPLAIMIGQRDGDVLGVTAGEYCRVMALGGLSQVVVDGPTGVAGDAVYVSDTGTLSLVPGTYIRQVGDVAKVYAGPFYDVAVAAVANSIPRGNAGGSLTGTYPNPTIAAGAVDTTQLADYAVTPVKIDSRYVYQAVSNGSTTSTSPVVIATATPTYFGGGNIKIAVMASPAGTLYDFTAYNPNSSDRLAYLRVRITKSDASYSEYAFTYYITKQTKITLPPLHLVYDAGVTADTYTISLRANVNNSDTTITWQNVELVAYNP